MAVTVQSILDNFNTQIGDSSTDRITAAQRLSYATTAVVWLQETLLNDHQVKSYTFDYFDTINYYNVTSVVPDLLETNNLNTKVLKSNSGTPFTSSGGGLPFTRKSSQELKGHIGSSFSEDEYSIERRDGNVYLVINHVSKYQALLASSFDSLTADGGTWAADAINSDATNLRVDNTDGSNGSTGSLAFDITVAQSANNRATIQNTAITTEDLTDEQDLTTWLLDFKLPSITNITSVTFYWGSSSSNYWSVTSTTNYDGSAFTADFNNTAKFAWLGATKTGTPVVTAITFFRIDINYGAGQADATAFKVDNLRLVRPEQLMLSYTSWYVGTTSGGTAITAFAATTDIPYFSGKYDQYIFACGSYAAGQAFTDLRLDAEAASAYKDADAAVKRVQNVFPKSITREEKSFKVRGNRLWHGRRLRNIRPR